MRVELTRTYRFEAARHLTGLPPEHICSGTHGHSFRLRLYLEGEIDPDSGILQDYADIDTVVQEKLVLLDHKYINRVGEDLSDALLQNPTNERLCKWFWDNLKPRLPLLQRVELAETPESTAAYWGQ